jgi:hypothetical protein
LVEEFRSADKSNLVHGADEDPRYLALRDEADELSDLADQAALALLDLKPATIAGAVALLRLGFERGILDTWYTWPENVTEDSRNFGDRDWFDALADHVADALAAHAV